MATKTGNTSIFRLGDLPKDIATRAVKLPREVAEDVTTRGRDVWLAGLGALATVQEEGTDLFQTLVKQGEKLVERGETVEAKGKVKIESLRNDLTVRQEAVVEKVEENVYEPVMEALKRFGVPTRAEVAELSKSVETLTTRVNALIRMIDQEVVVAAAAERTMITVQAREDGWVVLQGGIDAPMSVSATKDEAVEKARGLANAKVPSQLVVLKKDGTVQDTYTYDA